MVQAQLLPQHMQRIRSQAAQHYMLDAGVVVGLEGAGGCGALTGTEALEVDAYVHHTVMNTMRKLTI